MLELIFFQFLKIKFVFLMEVNFLEEKKGKMAVEEVDKRGGSKTSETYGELFFKEIKRKGTKAKEIGRWQL